MPMGRKGMPILLVVFVDVHMPISLDAHKIVEEGGAAVQPVGKVNTIGGLAWMGRNR
jgi:hypothetical protein